MPAKTKRKTGYERLKAHRAREKARAELLKDFLANAPEGISDRIRFGFHEVNGELECFIRLKDQVAADYMNAFSRRIGIDPKAVMREMAQHALMKLKRGEFAVEGAGHDD